MELVVGVNSYFDIAEADTIVHSKFLSTNKLRKLWDELNNEDKIILIISAHEQYDSDQMLYKGKKVNNEQSLQFPRYIHNEVVECPEVIKTGLIIQSLYDISESFNEELELKDSGIKSFADGSGARIEFDTEHTVKTNNNINNKVWSKYFSGYSMIC